MDLQFTLAIFVVVGVVLLITELSVNRKFKKLGMDDEEEKWSEKMGIWLKLSALIAFAGAVIGAAVFGAAWSATWFTNAPQVDHPTCWKDPEPHFRLDFDFHTFVGGHPVRCGYTTPRPGSVLPRVLGEQDRAVYSDILCYSMAQTECPKNLELEAE